MQKPMRFVWQSLLWKEWQEQKWKLLGFTLLLLLSHFLLQGGDFRALPYGNSSIILIYCVLAGTFVGMQVAGRENGQGTMAFLRTLPVPMRKPALSKLLVAWVTVVLPLLFFAGFAYLYLRGQGMGYGTHLQGGGWRWIKLLMGNVTLESWAIVLGLGGVVAVSSLLLWTAAIGVNQSDEIRAVR